MKNVKSNLDEMQEQKLLKIEHNGCYLAFWGLLVAIMVQSVIGGENVLRNLAGEWIMFMALSIYLVIACLKNGIWDRRLKANTKTNFLISLCAGIVIGAIFYFVSLINYGDQVGAIATAIVMLIVLFVMVFVVLCINTAIYKKRTAKIEKKLDEENEK